MRLALAAVALLAAMCPAAVRASGARIPITCTSTVTRLEEVPGVGVRETEECADASAWLDVSAGVDLVALQLTGERRIVSLGATPSMGLMVAWKPPGWALTPLVLGGELNLAMTLISPEIGESGIAHVEIWAIAGLNILGWLAIGIGGRFGLAVRDGGDDFAHLVLTGGMRVPL